MCNVRLIASRKRAVVVTRSLSQVYVEDGGGDRNFELLRELLASYPNLAKLHVHLLRGNFSNALSECSRIHDDLVELETFAFTSEVPVSCPYEPESSLTFTNFATVYTNVRHKRSGDLWSCVELDHLAYSPHQVLPSLPSPVAMVAVTTDSTEESFGLASRRKFSTHVHKLYLLLLLLVPAVKSYPTSGTAYRDNLRGFFSVPLEHVVELNLTWFHFHRDFDPTELLPEEALKRLHAFSAPPCVFRSQCASSTSTGRSNERQPLARTMAVSANNVTVRLSMNEGVSDLVQKLDALNPYAVNEVVLRNCVPCKPAELCAQIGRCVRLRSLSCVGCALQPSKVLKFMLEQLRYLQHLELSLVEVSEVDSEINSMRPIALEMLDVIRYHSLRRLYVEVGGELNFDLLWELLLFCPNLTELHVHFVRGTFSNALAQCHRFHEQLHQLEMFTFTSELPASVPFLYEPDPSLTFTTCATVCANVRHDRSHVWWSCVELSQLVLSRDRAILLPTQLVAFAAGDSRASVWEGSLRHSWARVRELCLLLLPSRPSLLTYPKAGAACHDYLQHLFVSLDSIAELNVSSFHFRLDIDLKRLLMDTPLGRSLLALSVPPCWFPRQSSVRLLQLACPNLKDLDVRNGSRGGHLRCTSCNNVLYRNVPVHEPCDAPMFSSTSIARLTLCDVTYRVLMWYFQAYKAATTLRLAEWCFAESSQYRRLCRRLSEGVAIRCLVLQHRDLPIDDPHLQACLGLMPSLQHLSLLTSMQVSDTGAAICVYDCVARSAQLNRAHLDWTGRSNKRQPLAQTMAVSANDVTVRLSMDEGVSDLVQQLDALNPYAVSALVLRNCVPCEPAQLCAQISRCVRLRRLSCVGSALQPSRLFKLMLENLRYLQHLELSLVEDLEVVVDSEINSMRPIATQMRGVIRYHSLRRMYVEVGGDRNFELLWELLVFCPNLTDLHVHFVRGTFSNALAHCRRLHEQLDQLEMFTFTSELPASVPFPYEPDPTLTFATCAAVCANVRHDRSHDWWSCVELSHLVLSRDRAVLLPTQLVVFAAGDLWASLWEGSRRHSWSRVRELCLLLLPPRPSMQTYPMAGAVCRVYLKHLFFALDSIAELNVSSFHFRLDINLKRLLKDNPLWGRLLALSVPPCWFSTHSSVRLLLSACPNLKDLDVRVGSRGGYLRCTSCYNVLYSTVPVHELSGAPMFLSTSITKLTLCDVTYKASLCHMTSLQHLCLLTSMQVSDGDAAKCVSDCVARAAQLKCVHIHYKRDTDGLEQRVTWLKRRRDKVLLRGGPCFACCSTATFIGLVKPVNRNCEAYL
ncbi:hypothetical protein HPB52_009863 [Rhipicephalus sanguineus]|uniref:Uncharacterized protein n=1 Tax=Rhipicephalus sanguineus TaxID=34632 RepID=A0A9D4SSK3_RHISA|nr:hypothetical protein HPB52_009863 [Rhipicephalus sanguineus]